MVVTEYDGMNASFSYPDTKWTFHIGVAPNDKGLTLAQAYSEAYSQLVPASEDSEYGYDIKSYSMTVDSVTARRLTVLGFGDVGGTRVVLIRNGMVYDIGGSTGEPWTDDETDVLKFIETLKFID